MQENLFPSGKSKSIKYIIIALVSVSLLSPILTFFLHHYFNLPGPQDFLPLSLFYLKKGYFFSFLTYAFIHSEDVGISLSLLFSLLLQMTLLWFTASEIVGRFGEKRFLLHFFSAILLSGLITGGFLFLTNSKAILFGSTPVLFSLLAVWMLMVKEQELSFFLLARIKIKTIIMIIFGITFIIKLSYGQIIPILADITAIIYGLFFGHVFYKLSLPFLPSATASPPPKKTRHSSAEIIDITGVHEDPDDFFMDQMLDKIAQVGREGLTEKERKRMDAIVKRRRKSQE